MTDYAVCQIAGKQFIVEPNKELAVPFLGEISEFECDKVVLISEKDKISLGSPFLKNKLIFEVLKQDSLKKLRVATYKPKANQRRVIGHKAKQTKILLKKLS